MKNFFPYKHVFKNNGILYLVVLVFFFSACKQQSKDQNKNSDTTHKISEQTSGTGMAGMNMNPDTAMAGMNMNSDTAMTGMDMNADTVNETYWSTLPTNNTVIAQQQVVKPEFAEMNFTITGNGYIDFDIRRNRKVSVRISGRIERLYVKYNYQYIHKGEKILELYSPELNTYIEEYLYLIHQTTDTVLQRNAWQKLALLGLSRDQITQITKSGETTFTIPVYSPYEGVVLFNPSASTNDVMKSGSASNAMGEMSNNSSSIANPVSSLPDNSIREGMYVGKDQALFWVNDFREAWGILAFNKEDEKYVQKGQSTFVESELLPGKPFITSIQFIEPVYKEGQKFSQTRIYISNDSHIFKQNSLLTANVTVPVKSLMVPSASVYYLGKTAIVWVRKGVTKEGSNIFQARAVRTGHRTNDEVEIKGGLLKEEMIAKDAAYLADRESLIQF